MERTGRDRRRHGAFKARVVTIACAVVAACLLLCAPAFAAEETEEVTGTTAAGCKYAVTITAEAEASTGAFTASLKECSEIPFQLSGSFSVHEVTLEEVEATAEIAGESFPIEQNLDYRFDVGAELARAIKSPGETVVEREANEAAVKAGAERLVLGTEQELVELAAEKLLGKSTGRDFQRNARGLLKGEQEFCQGFQSAKAGEVPTVCFPHVCPSGCAHIGALTTNASGELSEEDRRALCPLLNTQPTIDFVCVPTFVAGTLNAKEHPLVVLTGGALILTPRSLTEFQAVSKVESTSSIASFGGLIVGDNFALQAPKIELAGGLVESFGAVELAGREKVDVGSVTLGDLGAAGLTDLGEYVNEVGGWADLLDAVSKEPPATFPSIPTSGNFALPTRVTSAELTVKGEAVSLGSGSVITAQGLGGLGQNGAEPAPGGAREFFGGSHGGYGGYPRQNFLSLDGFGLWHSLGDRGAVADSPFQPKEGGAGGAAGEHEAHGEGTPGGGVVSIQTTGQAEGVTGSVALDGRIDVLGYPEVNGGGAGAGGSTYLETGALSGVGTIDANGGDDPTTERSNAGTGGGGRIAIVDGEQPAWSGTLEARGGIDLAFKGLSGESAASGTGGAGTIFERQVAFSKAGTVEKGTGPFPQGTLTIDGGRPAGSYPPPDGTPLESAWNSNERRLVIDGEARVYAEEARFGEIDVRGGATLTTPPSEPPSPADETLTVRAGTLEIGLGSQVTMTGRGYAGGSASDEAGHGAGKTEPTELPATGQFGGSHGGVGGANVGTPQTGAHAGSTYDSAAAPTLPGAGGAAEVGGADGSPGGGVLDIHAQTLIDAGAISADGGSNSGPTATDPTPFDHSAGGAGAGGSVVVEATTLSGSGTISAAGGSSCLQIPPLLLGGHAACPQGRSGAGGGGRIAMQVQSACEWTGALNVSGGAELDPGLSTQEAALSAGGAGTIFPASEPAPRSGCTAPPPHEESTPPPPPPPKKEEETKVPAKPLSPGVLSAVAKQKVSPTLIVSFLCKAKSCRVTMTATVKAGKEHFSVKLKATTVKQGQKLKFKIALSKKQRRALERQLAKHKSGTASVVASVVYAEGQAKAGPLDIHLLR
jgi:hypothetical protein